MFYMALRVILRGLLLSFLRLRVILFTIDYYYNLYSLFYFNRISGHLGTLKFSPVSCLGITKAFQIGARGPIFEAIPPSLSFARPFISGQLVYCRRARPSTRKFEIGRPESAL